MKLYFKINEKLKKVFNYFSIFIIIFGTTFGSLNSAYAADLTLVNDETWDDASDDAADVAYDPSAGDNVNIDGNELTISSDALAVGNITDTDADGIKNDVIITNTNGGGALSITIESIDIADDLTVDMIDNEAALTLNVTRNISTGGVFEIESAEATVADTDLTVTVGGDITNAAAMKLTADTTSDVTLNVAGDITSGADTVLADKTGLSKIVLNGSAAQTITDGIKGAGAGQGTVQVSNTGGTVTFDEKLGETNELLAITLDADSTTVFSAATDADTITSAGTASFNAGLVKTDTLTISSGTVTIDSATGANALALEVVAGSDATDVNMSANTTLNFTIATTETNIIDAKIDGTADGEGDLNFYNTNDAAPGVFTLNDDIGFTKELNSITIGTSTKAGSVKTIDTATIDIGTGALNIVAGNIATEDSQLEIADNLTATTTLTRGLLTGGNAILKTSDDVTVAGTIDAAGSGSGSAVLSVTGTAKTAIFNSNIGSSSTLDSITIDTASASFKGNVSATTMSLADAAGDATFIGTSAQTFTGNITATDGEGTLKNSNTTAALTVTGTVGAEDARLLEVEIDNGTNTILQDKIHAITLDIDSNAAAEFVQVSEGNIIGTDGGTTGALQIASGAVIHLDKDVVDGTTVFDVTEATGSQAGVLIAGNFTIRPSSSFTTGTVKFIDGANADLLDSTTDATVNAELANILVTDNALTDFTVAAGATAGADVNITASAKSDATTSSELSTTINDAKSLRAANIAVKTNRSSDSTADTSFNDAINAFGSFGATEDTALAKQVGPQNDMILGSSVAAQAVTGSVQGIMSSRMASLRSGDAYFGTGIAAGGMSAQSGFIQVFGSTAEQNNKTVGSGTQYGYESDTEGLAIGFDGVTDDGMTIGVSLATANTDVDGKGTGKSTNSIDTYSASLYMDRATDAGYVEGSVTFGLNENSTSRIVNTAGLDRTYTGSYDSQSLSVNISAGAPIESGSGYLTPFGSFTASFMDIDPYTEKSTVANDSLRLKVAQDDVNSMIGTLGIKYHAEMGNGGTPMISLAINNEFGDATIDSTNTYQGGGTAFKTSTAVEELSATLGLGYSYGSDAASIELAYEADVNDDDYLSHYGSIKLVGKF